MSASYSTPSSTSSTNCCMYCNATSRHYHSILGAFSNALRCHRDYPRRYHQEGNFASMPSPLSTVSFPFLLACVSFRDAQKREQNYLVWLAGLLLNLPATDKILWCWSNKKATAEAMAKASDTKFYHSELPDDVKKTTLDSFRAGAGSFRVLYTTSALSAGLDIRDIRVVIHLRKPNSMLDYGQEFGRGCRDGRPGWAFIIYDPKHKPFTLQTGQDDTGVSEMASWLSTPVCRRLGLSLFFDGRASNCLQMVTVQLCDICQITVAKVLSMLSQHFRFPDAYIAEYS